MARRVILLDDFTGEESEDVQTITFMLNGSYYELDLNEKNLKAMEKHFAKYVAKARTITRLRASAASTLDEAPAIREWAKANGKDISERGRIPQEIVDEYHKAMAAGPDEGNSENDSENSENSENDSDENVNSDSE